MGTALEKEVIDFSPGYEIKYNTDSSTGRKVITSESNRMLIKLAREGNVWAREDFFAENQGLIRAVVNATRNLKIDADDRTGHCQIAMLNAFNTYDLEGGAEFSTYATLCMQNWLLRQATYLNREKRKGDQNTISGDTPVNDSGEGDLTILDMVGGVETSYSSLEQREYLKVILEEAFAKMKPRHREIWEYRYLHEMEVRDIASIYGTTRQAVSRTLITAMETVRAVASKHTDSCQVLGN